MIRIAAGFLFFLFIINTGYADHLCDTGCRLHINFPTGGDIQAVNDMTFVFGKSGQINTITSSVGFSCGEALVLYTGERLIFAAGGQFDLGEGGNLDYSQLIIHSDGDIYLSAIGGKKTLNVPAGSSFVIGGKARIEFDADELILEGTLTRCSECL